jgi:protein-disulfide isomerase
MHALLFENQDRIGRYDLSSYAESLGLDVEAFDLQLDQHVHRGRVRADFQDGIRSGVNGTPAFFINGVRYDGPVTVDAMLMAMSASTSH